MLEARTSGNHKSVPRLSRNRHGPCASDLRFAENIVFRHETNYHDKAYVCMPHTARFLRFSPGTRSTAVPFHAQEVSCRSLPTSRSEIPFLKN